MFRSNLKILAFLCLIFISKSFVVNKLKHCKLSGKTNLYMSSDNGKDDAVSRRRKRRGSNKISENEEKAMVKTVEKETESSSVSIPNSDGSSSLEDLFGLGNEQLRELMEQELPVPREDLITGKAVKNEDKNKVFKLPDLGEFMQDVVSPKKDKEDRPVQNNNGDNSKVDRTNRDEYLRVLQLNPFADADESMFLDEYDIIPSIFGSGKLLGIPVPYLQTGHGILLFISLLAALVYAPGNPLTEFPPEIRKFLKDGLLVTYSVNLVLAVQALFNAKSKNLPQFFWFMKTFLLGGIAYFEITQAKDPKKLNENLIDPSDRKSRRRN